MRCTDTVRYVRWFFETISVPLISSLGSKQPLGFTFRPLMQKSIQMKLTTAAQPGPCFANSFAQGVVTPMISILRFNCDSVLMLSISGIHRQAGMAALLDTPRASIPSRISFTWKVFADLVLSSIFRPCPLLTGPTSHLIEHVCFLANGLRLSGRFRYLWHWHTYRLLHSSIFIMVCQFLSSSRGQAVAKYSHCFRICLGCRWINLCLQRPKHLRCGGIPTAADRHLYWCCECDGQYKIQL